MLEINKIARNLEYKEHGIWFSKDKSEISYPKSGNVDCFEIEKNSFWFKHRNKCIVESIRLFPPNGTFFDIGGGNGYVAMEIQSAGWDTVLVEPGHEGAINAKSRGLDSVICATLENADFKPNSIPAIGLFDVLEHIENDKAFLKTIKALLIPNGRVYISVPAYNFLWSVNDDSAGHFRRYTLKRLISKLKFAGFKIDLKTYIFSFLPLPVFLSRVIPSKLGIRKENDLNRSKKEHGQPGSWIGHLLSWSINLELKALKSNKTLPFGGSCLVIATSE